MAVPPNYSLYAAPHAGSPTATGSQNAGTISVGHPGIRLSADFSKETAERRKAFLSLRTHLRHLDMKVGLIEPARMVITKNGESRNFYDLEDLRTFLEGLQDQTQSIEMTARMPQDLRGLPLGAAHSASASESGGRFTIDPQARERDLERLTKSYDDRGQVLQAVAMHIQLSDRDKSRSPLKPTVAPT
ncbi:hypothetical protein NDU88_005040 [Pleurodeles waltl]|uniref:Uncharacterized protein n=1 Tax=Pleurodeles waltl TaxID=8319 RepID=A0AAV7QE71_PLEWA|nr:hypothetical protein NDU88_005040 [Pleurodeles waltl]